jgi:hypothetical protein
MRFPKMEGLFSRLNKTVYTIEKTYITFTHMQGLIRSEIDEFGRDSLESISLSLYISICFKSKMK